MKYSLPSNKKNFASSSSSMKPFGEHMLVMGKLNNTGVLRNLPNLSHIILIIPKSPNTESVTRYYTANDNFYTMVADVPEFV